MTDIVKMIGLFIIQTGLIWFIVLTMGIDLDTKEKFVIGGGSMVFVALIGIGTYLCFGGM